MTVVYRRAGEVVENLRKTEMLGLAAGEFSEVPKGLKLYTTRMAWRWQGI